jgi:hypothetical protein
VNDSATGYAGRVSVKRYFYSEKGKHYMLVGVPWNWINTAPAGTLIIDPTTTVTNSEDTRLQDAGNYGSGTTLAIGKPSGGNKRRVIIKFNITGISGSATILNARMNLWYYSNSGTPIDRWVQAHQLLVPWNEMEATSVNRQTTPSIQAWKATYGKIGPGSNPANEDANGQYESKTFFSSSEPLGAWKVWELTALTQKWINGTAANYGVILWATNEDTDGQAVQFNSSEA